MVNKRYQDGSEHIQKLLHNRQKCYARVKSYDQQILSAVQDGPFCHSQQWSGKSHIGLQFLLTQNPMSGSSLCHVVVCAGRNVTQVQLVSHCLHVPIGCIGCVLCGLCFVMIVCMCVLSVVSQYSLDCLVIETCSLLVVYKVPGYST